MPSDHTLTIEGILTYFNAEVVPALAAAYVIDDQFPEEALNEIRASYTHMARANSVGVGHQDYEKELDAAFRHLKRTCLDSLKVCIYVTAQRCEDAVDALTEEQQLPNNVYQNIANLRDQRKALSAHEGQNPTHTVIEQLKKLLDQYDEFYRGLDTEFAGKTASERRLVRKRRERWNVAKGFVLGVVGSIIASYIFTYLLS